MTTRDLDAALASFFEREATADGGAAILEAALEQTSRRRPRPAWVAAVRGMTVGATPALDPRTRSRIGYALVLAALLAAIVVGALFLAGTRPPQLSESLPCVGQPATLCGHTAGVWTSTTFVPGLTLTFPDDRWFTREQPGKLELKALPMTSLVELKLDPIPRSTAWEKQPDLSGTRESLAAWIERDPEVIVDRRVDRMTAAGLPITTFRLRPVDPGACAFVFVARATPTAHDSVLDLCHYAYRLHLLDIGGGHVISALLTALDAQGQTLDTLEVGTMPIVDSIRPPPTFSP